MAKPELKYIKEPGYIGKLKLKNRLIHMGSQSGMSRKDKDENGVPRIFFDYYEALAKGGFALVSIGGGIIAFNEDGSKCTSPILGDWTPELLKLLADTLHKYDCLACCQLLLGSMARRLDNYGTVSLSAGKLTQEDLNGLVPLYTPTEEMTHEQIHEVVKTFAEVSKALKDAGFDCVEINAGHVHGLNTFVSPAWNKRTDEYGGSPENRARILVEINHAIHDLCGEDFPIISNLSACEFMLDGGINVEDTVTICKLLEENGSALIHSRFEVYHEELPELDIVRSAHEVPDIDLYPGYLDKDLSEYGIDNSWGKGINAWTGAAATIKQAVNIPVSVMGRTDAFTGDQLIRDGKCDFISICRRAIADYDYCQKIIDGDYDDIRPCIGCFTCYDTSERGLIPWCMVHGGVLAGKDFDTVYPAEVKKKVLVVGSGATGLEAARVAALRGHDVILAEKEPALGGTLPLAGMINDFHEDFLGFSQWQVRQVEKLGVDIRTKTTVDAAYIEKVKPDVIILAVGSSENIPDIPGIDKKIVTTGEQLHNALKVATKFFNVEKLGKLSKLYLPLGKSVILIGGGIQGLQTAVFLMKRGRKVTIVEQTDEFGTGMLDCGPKPNLLRWLYEEKVPMYKSATIKEIVDDGMIIITEEGEEKKLSATDIVTTLPMLPNLDLYEKVKDMAPEVYAIGDCNPRIIEDPPYPQLKLEPVSTKLAYPRFTAMAIREAWRIVRDI